jgi:SAM-dependent methyltransferase
MGTTRFDYDSAPQRYRLGMRLAAEHTLGESLYDRLARRLAAEPAGPVLDVGTGDGPLRAAVGAGREVVGLDLSLTLLAGQPGSVVLGQATALPFADRTFVAVVAVNVLDHLADPRVAIAEAHRVLRPGGLFMAATTSRRDSPELAPYWTPQPTPFDAEDAPRIVQAVFGEAEVDPWDAPQARLQTPKRCGTTSSPARPPVTWPTPPPRTCPRR